MMRPDAASIEAGMTEAQQSQRIRELEAENADLRQECDDLRLAIEAGKALVGTIRVIKDEDGDVRYVFSSGFGSALGRAVECYATSRLNMPDNPAPSEDEKCESCPDYFGACPECHDGQFVRTLCDSPAPSADAPSDATALQLLRDGNLSLCAQRPFAEYVDELWRESTRLRGVEKAARNAMDMWEPVGELWVQGTANFGKAEALVGAMTILRNALVAYREPTP